MMLKYCELKPLIWDIIIKKTLHEKHILSSLISRQCPRPNAALKIRIWSTCAAQRLPAAPLNIVYIWPVKYLCLLLLWIIMWTEHLYWIGDCRGNDHWVQIPLNTELNVFVLNLYFAFYPNVPLWIQNDRKKEAAAVWLDFFVCPALISSA